MNKNDQEFLVQKIRSQYTEKEHTQLDTLKELDAKVKRPANVFAYIFGIIGSLVLGGGMCLAMEVIGDAVIIGIVIGVIGIIMVSINYLIYKSILGSRRQKYAAQIMDLSEKLLKNQ